MRGPTRCHGIVALVGLGFGFVLSRLGFSDYERLHAMFTFESWNLTLAFAVAVGVLAVVFQVDSRGREFPRRRIHPGTIPGGLLFGLGWAMSGACPSIALVQIGEGRGLALLTLAGIVVGTQLYGPMHRHFFDWPSESCSS